ncbi:MAG: HEAT repeat domain-containing protein [Planctomycetota bacterium]
MVRRIILIGVVIFAAFLFSMGDVLAGRLGGAYRGPYEDTTQPEDEVDDSMESSGGTDQADTDVEKTGGEGTTTEPPPAPGDDDDDDDDSGDDDDDSNEPGAANEGSGSKEAKAPGSGTSGPTGSGSLGEGGPAGGDQGRVVEDVEAFWPFYFEYNKEWILDRMLRERGARTHVPENSSVWWFRWATGQKVKVPVTKEQKEKLILPLLIESLKSRSEWVRDAAVLALGKLGDPGGLPHIIKRAQDTGEKSDVREDSLLALGLTGQEAAVVPLRQALEGDGSNLKAFAALGLGLLGRKDEETVKLLLHEYKSLIKRPDPRAAEVAACIAVSLGMIGDESVVDELASPMRRRKHYGLLKIYICQALGRIGGEKSRDWLVRALRDKDKDVMAAAVLALSDFPNKRVLKELKGIKGGHRMSLLYSLLARGRIGGEFAPDDLLRKQIVADLRKITEKPQKDKYQFMYGALAMAILGDDSSNKFFAEYLSADKRKKYKHEVHSAMAMALALMGDRRANRELREIALKGNFEPDYRGYAAFSLGVMGDTSVKEELKREIMDEKRRELLRSGCWAIGLLGDRSDIPWLIKCLKMEDKHRVRGAAAVAIGLIGDNSAVKPLLKMARDDAELANRAFAIAALGCLVDREPVPRIARIFRNVHYKKHFPIMRDVLSNL